MVLSDSSYIHNVALDLKDADIKATALDAKMPLSCCADSLLGQGMCLISFFSLLCESVLDELGFGFCRQQGNHREVVREYTDALRWAHNRLAAA